VQREALEASWDIVAPAGSLWHGTRVPVVEGIVLDPDHTPDLQSSPGPDLVAVLGDEWPHDEEGESMRDLCCRLGDRPYYCYM
jgi:hypothetical protein